MEALMAMMVMMMMLAGCGIGAVWMLSKRNGGNNPIGIAMREFMAVPGNPAPPHAAAVNPRPQHVDVMPVQSLHATHAVNGTPPGGLQRPGKAMALVLLFLAVLYLISPLDLIPDLIPGLCHLDDIGVLTLAVKNALKAFA